MNKIHILLGAQRPLKLFLWVMIFLCCLGFIGLAKPMLMVPDEARYSEIPREMLALRDFVTPHLNYIQYFEKPPLMYWLQAGVMALFGLSRFAARFANALLGVLQAAMLYVSCFYLFRRDESTLHLLCDDQKHHRITQRTAWLSSVMLATSFLYFILSHFVTLDMALSFFMTGCLLCFLMAMQSPEKHRAFYGSALFAALAFLTKGLIALVLPGLIIVIWTTVFSQWKILAKMHWFRAIFLFAVIAVPWHVWVQYRHPEFLHFYFVEQHFNRYLTLSAGRYKPFWFFIPILLLGLFPWTFFLWDALKRAWQTRNKTLGFLAIWGLSVIGFFSISQSKLMPYILPAFAPLILLIASYVAEQWEQQTVRRISIILYMTASAMFLIAFALCLIPRYFTLNEPVSGRIVLNIISTLLLLGAIQLARLLGKNAWQKAILFLVGFQSLLLIYVLYHLNDLRDFAVEHLAEKIQVIEKQYPNTEVVSYKTYYQDLPFYLHHRVTIVEWQNELDFGAAHQSQDWLIDEATFLTRWNSPRVLLAVASNDDFILLKNNKVMTYKIADENNQVLFSNHKVISP